MHSPVKCLSPDESLKILNLIVDFLFKISGDKFIAWKGTVKLMEIWPQHNPDP